MARQLNKVDYILVTSLHINIFYSTNSSYYTLFVTWIFVSWMIRKHLQLAQCLYTIPLEGCESVDYSHLQGKWYRNLLFRKL